MIAAIFLRITIMIAVLIKCTIYENCDLGRNLPKNIIILSLYVIVIMISFLFIRTTIMITVFTKISYIRVFMRTTSMITFLKEDCDHDRNIHKNILYSSLYENYEHDHIPKRGLRPWPQCRSPHKMSYFWVFMRTATIIAVLRKCVTVLTKWHF